MTSVFKIYDYDGDLAYRYFNIYTKVSKGAKIRNRYNQVPHLTRDTNEYNFQIKYSFSALNLLARFFFCLKLFLPYFAFVFEIRFVMSLFWV